MIIFFFLSSKLPYLPQLITQNYSPDFIQIKRSLPPPNISGCLYPVVALVQKYSFKSKVQQIDQAVPSKSLWTYIKCYLTSVFHRLACIHIVWWTHTNKCILKKNSHFTGPPYVKASPEWCSTIQSRISDIICLTEQKQFHWQHEYIIQMCGRDFDSYGLGLTLYCVSLFFCWTLYKSTAP